MVVFDPTKVEREADIQAVKPGQYIVMIKSTNERYKDGNMGLGVFYKIIANDEYVDNLIVDNFNLMHHMEVTQKLGRSSFAKMLDCIEMGNKPLNKYDDICNKFLKIDTSLKAHWKDPTKEVTQIDRYLSLSAADKNIIKRVIEEAKKAKQAMKQEEDDVPF